MISNLFLDGQVENTVWLAFYDCGQTVNDYGQRVIGSALMGSAMCLSIHLGLQTKRTQDGIIYYDTYEFHKKSGLPNVYPMRTRVKINGELYEVVSKTDGGELTNAIFFRAVKRIG